MQLRYKEAMRDFQVRYWTDQLLIAGTVSGAAKRAGVNRTYLHKVIKTLGVSVPQPQHRGRYIDKRTYPRGRDTNA